MSVFRLLQIAEPGRRGHNVAPFFIPYMWKVLPVTQKPDQCLGEWIDREAIAEAMIPLIGQLYRNNNVVTSIHGRGLINRSVIAIMKRIVSPVIAWLMTPSCRFTRRSRSSRR